MNQRIHIIGIGSPFGDDRLGWEAAEILREYASIHSVPSDFAKITVLDRPGAMLPLHWQQADCVILLDAIRSGAVPGTRHRFEAGDLARAGQSCSSHGFGVAEAVALARALGQLPARLTLHGLEADPNWKRFTLSPAVLTALPAFCSDIAATELHFPARRIAARLA